MTEDTYGVKPLLWSVPLLVIPASCLFRRYAPFRGAVRRSYFFILVGAFFLNLFLVSFWNEWLNTAEIMLVNFIIADLFWVFFKVKSRKLFTVLVVAALCAYGFEFRHWFAGGPAHAVELWNPPAAGTYVRNGDAYRVSERVLYASFGRPARSVVLWKRLGRSPFGKQIKRWHTPRWLGDVRLVYRWSETGEGIRLDIHAAGYRLWTMSEGF